MTPRLKKLLIVAGILVAFLPIWVFGVLPRVFPKIACVIQQPDGTPVKAWGEAACLDNGQPTVVLRAE